MKAKRKPRSNRVASDDGLEGIMPIEMALLGHWHDTCASIAEQIDDIAAALAHKRRAAIWKERQASNV